MIWHLHYKLQLLQLLPVNVNKLIENWMWLKNIKPACVHEFLQVLLIHIFGANFYNGKIEPYLHILHE